MDTENIRPIQRSELWKKIYELVDTVKLEASIGDSVDKPSLTTAIENLFDSLIKKQEFSKPEAVEFFEWLHKKYYKGFNGYVPYGWSSYASGKTIEELYDIFKNGKNGND